MFQPPPFCAVVLSLSCAYIIIGILLPSAVLGFILASTNPRHENLSERINTGFSWIIFIFFRWLPLARHQNTTAVLMIVFISFLVQVNNSLLRTLLYRSWCKLDRCHVRSTSILLHKVLSGSSSTRSSLPVVQSKLVPFARCSI